MELVFTTYVTVELTTYITVELLIFILCSLVNKTVTSLSSHVNAVTQVSVTLSIN